MVTAFQIILFFIIVVSFMGVFGEKDKSLDKMLAMFLGSLAAFIASVLLL